MQMKFIFLTIFVLLRQDVVSSAQAHVKLDNNGYINIVVAITNEVQESASTIQKIKVITGLKLIN